MAAYEEISMAEEDLCCPICFEDYETSNEKKLPKLLICLHTFCNSCVKSLTKNGGIPCPLCRLSHLTRESEIMDNDAVHEYLR